MTLSRTLPAQLSPRFRDAPRAVARSEHASFELVVAEGFVLRLRGLAGLEERELVPLLFPRCRSLQTFWMRTAIDVVWLELGTDMEGTVLAVSEAVPRWRTARAPRGTPRERTAAIELPAGDAEALGLKPGNALLVPSAG